MLAHLLAAHNVPFLLALALFGGLGALQLISLALGSELFSFLDDVTPDADTHVDVGHGSLGGALDVLGVGKVRSVRTSRNSRNPSGLRRGDFAREARQAR